MLLNGLAKSLDLSSAENLWGDLRLAVHRKYPHSLTALEHFWKKSGKIFLSQDVSHRCILTQEE